MSDIIDRGTVVRLEGETAFVRIAESGACKTCGANVLCGTSADGGKELPANNPVNAKIGDNVEIGERGNLMLVASLMQFGVPLLGFIGGIFLVHLLQFEIDSIPQELLMFLGGLAGLVTGGWFSWLWATHIAKQKIYAFEIIAIQR